MTSTIVHARSMVYAGHAYSPWGAGHGRRVYQERRRSDGQVELVCGKGLDDVAKLFPSEDFACLKSKRSREANLVSCPECARRIRAVGFVYAKKRSGS